MKTKILGVMVDNVTMNEAIQKIMNCLSSEGSQPYTIFTPNPEMIMLANKDEEFEDILNRSDLVIPDGIGVVLASKLNKVKIKERLGGYDLVLEIFDNIKDKDITVYFLGSAPGVAALAKEKMTEKYKNLKIIGVNDGFFDEKREKLIIKDIQAKKPDIILVGLGMGKQEKWINKHKARLGAKVYIGVGGSLDGFSGKVQRAPDIYGKLGVEWLYRLIKQPSRIKRQIYLPIFVFKVIMDKLKGKN